MILAVFIGGIVLAGFPLWLMYRALRMGVWNGRGIDVRREEQPAMFWFGIVMYAVIAAIISAFPIFIVWVRLH